MVNKFLTRVLEHPVAQNALSLFIVQIARYILPIITIPYLAKILEPEALGLVVFTQASVQWFEMLLDFGFNLSATREIARYRDNQKKVAEIVTGVMGASAFLIVLSGLVAVVMGLSIPLFKQHPDYLILGWLMGIFQGLSPIWYFQGMEQMRLYVTVDLGVRIATTICTFLWITTIGDAWKVLALQSISAFLIYGLMLIRIYRNIPWKYPCFTSSIAALRMSWNMFIFRCSVSLFTTINTFIIGVFLPPEEVAFFGEAQRLARSIGSLANPITQAVFPCVSYLISIDLKKAAKLVVINIIFIILGSCCLSVILVVFSPLIINVFLGNKFKPAIILLQLLVLLLPFMGLNYVLGIQWMLALNLEHIFNKIVMIAGLLNLIMSTIFTPFFGSKGMAITVVFTEAFVTSAMYIYLWWKHLSPYQVWKAKSI